MKEKTIIETQKKVEALIRVVQQLLNENQYLMTLAIGTMETVKLLPGYEEAVKILAERTKEAEEKQDKPKIEF